MSVNPASTRIDSSLESGEPPVRVGMVAGGTLAMVGRWYRRIDAAPVWTDPITVFAFGLLTAGVP